VVIGNDIAISEMITPEPDAICGPVVHTLTEHIAEQLLHLVLAATGLRRISGTDVHNRGVNRSCCVKSVSSPVMM